MTGFLHRLRARIRYRHFAREVADEIEFHRAMKEHELAEAGVAPDRVPDEARRALGSELAARELARSVWVAPFLDNLVQDLRYALRGLLRDRTFAATAVLTLALGIGATTAIFSVVNAALLKPPPYPHPERILTLALPDGLAHDGQVFHYLEERSRVFQAVAATGVGSGWNLVAGSHAEYVQGLPVSARYFSVLGVAPRLGREFDAAEDRPDGQRAVILSDAVWRRVFGARPGAIGETVRLGGVPHAIVGVMPAGFKSTPAADVWTPLQVSAQDSSWNTGVLARLRDSAAPEAAARELDGLRPGIRSELRRYATRGLWLHWISFQAAQGRAGRTTLLILLGAVAFLLLIACVNVASLQLVRSLARRREMATRMALGGGATRLVQQVLTESLVLALAGGAAGLLAAWWGVRGLARFVPARLLPSDLVGLDWRVLLAALAISLASGVLFGLAPAFALRRLDVCASLREGGRQTAGGATAWLRRAFNAVEVALAVILLVAAGLMVRTFVGLRAVDVGFDPARIVVGRMSLQGATDQARESPAVFFARTLSRLSAAPGVQAAAVASNVPIEQCLNLAIEPPPDSLVHDVRAVDFVYVTRAYFDLFRIPIREGRAFDGREDSGGAPVAIVNEAFARSYFGRQPVLGRSIQFVRDIGDRPREIVGVVGNVKAVSGSGWTHGMMALTSGSAPTIYVPVSQVPDGVLEIVHHFFPVKWAVRTQGDSPRAVAAVQEVVGAAAPTMPFIGFQTMEELIAEDIETQRFLMLLLTVFGGVAIALAVTGLYGLVAYAVVQHTREVALRLALGASVPGIVGRFVGEGFAVTAAGIAFGLGAAAAVTGLLRSLIVGVTPLDPLTFVSVGALVLAVACAASALPARRAARTNPAAALRGE